MVFLPLSLPLFLSGSLHIVARLVTGQGRWIYVGIAVMNELKGGYSGSTGQALAAFMASIRLPAGLCPYAEEAGVDFNSFWRW